MTICVLRRDGWLPATEARAVSYLDGEHQVVWEPSVPPGRLACDAERYDSGVRTSVARAHGLPADPLGFACAWTRAEVQAKLADVPIALWLRQPARRPGLARTMRTLVLPAERIVVTIGSAPQR